MNPLKLIRSRYHLPSFSGWQDEYATDCVDMSDNPPAWFQCGRNLSLWDGMWAEWDILRSSQWSLWFLDPEERWEDDE